MFGTGPIFFLEQIKDAVSKDPPTRPHIMLIKWLGYSPGLNPIGNIWSWIKHQVTGSTSKTTVEWRAEITRL